MRCCANHDGRLVVRSVTKKSLQEQEELFGKHGDDLASSLVDSRRQIQSLARDRRKLIRKRLRKETTPASPPSQLDANGGRRCDSFPSRLDRETVSDLCRAVEYLQQRIANRAMVLTSRASAAGKLDPSKAGAAIGTGGIILFHKSVILYGNPTYQYPCRKTGMWQGLWLDASLAGPTSELASARCLLGG